MVESSFEPKVIPRLRSSSDGRASTSRRVLDVVAGAVFLATVVAAFWFIHRFAVNMVYYDQWTDVNIIRLAHSGTLSFSALWAQHNENRVLFPNFVVLLLAYTTHFNLLVEDYLNGVIWCATTALLIMTHKRRSPATPWIWYCPVALVLLSFVPLGDTLFGYQLGWYLELLSLAAALFLVDSPNLTRLGVVAAACAAVVGSFSSLSGLLIWLAGFLVLYLRRRPGTYLIAWAAAGTVCTALYFVGFNFAALGGSSYLTRDPLGVIKFFFSTIGNLVGANANDVPGGADIGVLCLGVAVCVIAAVALFRGLRRGDAAGASGVALIVFGLCFVAFTALGRAQYGLGDAVRYSILELMIWVGAYLVLLEPLSSSLQRALSGLFSRRASAIGGAQHKSESIDVDGEERSFSGTQITLVITELVMLCLMVFQVVLASGGGFADSNGWYGEELAIADVTANINRASNALVLQELGGYPVAFTREMAQVARTYRLSLFDTAAVAQYRREGIFPYLTTSVLAPTSGATVSRSVVLKASDVVGPTVVQFRITGGSYDNLLIATARQTGSSWAATWDTSTVPNGGYLLSSALARGGKVVDEGDPIWIVVRN